MIYIILWTHFVADFILQTNGMAQGKSSSNLWLGKHISVYTAALFAALCFLTKTPILNITAYCLINGVIHFGVDYLTSRITKRLWEAERVHDFFVVIGFDQAVHMTTLIATLSLLK